MRIAAIADIHGSMAALEAVLADIQRRDIVRSPRSPRGMGYTTRPGRRFALAPQIVGLMFWFSRNRLVGSYLFLRATSRP